MQWYWVVIAVLVFEAFAVLLIYNGLVRARNMVDESWSGVDVQLTRRQNLVPNLIEAVRGYAQHEGALLNRVAEERTAALAAQGAEQATPPETALTQDIGRLLALAEAYPDLKASANFIELQEELVNLENQIVAARNIFNGNVRSYNDKVQAFPGLLVSRPAGFRPRAMFMARDEDRAVIEVAT